MSNVIDILIQAKDAASKSIAKVQGAVVGLGDQAKKTGKGLGDFAEKNKAAFAGLAVASGSVLATMGLGFKKAIEESNKFENAMAGLSSIVTGTGNDFSKAEKVIQNFTKDGLVNTADAATALKNLLARGFSLDESAVLMDRFKNSATFGRQAALGLGEAVRGATEGLKNMNPMLVDNAGVTKNMSIMYDEYATKIGTTAAKLTDAQKRQAEYNGIVNETKHQMNDAAKYAATFSGQQAKLTTEISKAYKAIGDGLKPALASIMGAITPVIQKVTEFATKYPKVTSVVLLSITAIAGLTLVLGTLGMILPGVMISVGFLTKAVRLFGKTIMTTVIPAIRAFFIAIGPVGWVITGIIVVAGLLYKAWTSNFLGIRDITANVLSWIYENMSKLTPYIYNVMKGVITLTNLVIRGINAVTGKAIPEIQNVAMVASMATSWAVTKMKDGVKGASDKLAQYEQNHEDLAKSAQNALGGITDVGSGATESIQDLIKKTGEGSDKMKELKEKAEEAIKPILEKFEKVSEEIKDLNEKIKEQTGEWTKYKTEGKRALQEIAAEIRNVANEAKQITIDFGAQKDTKLAERLVEINYDLAESEKKLSKVEDLEERISLEEKMNKLRDEASFITTNASAEAIRQADSYSKLSEAQRIVVDLEKEKGIELEENRKKMDSLIEKRMVLEAQANQKSLDDQRIFTEEKDGILTASIMNEKGVKTELHDQEAINMAYEVEQKQKAMQTEMEDLNTQLQNKLTAQQGHLTEVQTAYDTFNKYLKDETKKTANDMIAQFSAVTQSLQTLIVMKAKAGMGDTGGAGVDGARASGGPVRGGGTYLVGERGPELFTPQSSGSIVPNNALGGMSVSINFGGVSVRDDSDIQKISNLVTEEMTRKLRLYNLGIA